MRNTALVLELSYDFGSIGGNEPPPSDGSPPLDELGVAAGGVGADGVLGGGDDDDDVVGGIGGAADVPVPAPGPPGITSWPKRQPTIAHAVP